MKFRHTARNLAGALAAAGVCSCAVGPNYHKPDLPSSARGELLEAPVLARAQPSGTDALPDHWWTLFSDPLLDRLIDEALRHNTDIRSAVANLKVARYTLVEARAGFWPTTELSASYNHSRTGSASIAASNGSTVTATPGTTVPNGFTSDFYSAAFDVSYELDLFGRVRRSVEAARGDAASAAAALDAARISVAAQTALGFADACGYAAQLASARESASLQSRTVELTQSLYDAGRSNRRDLDQARAQFEQTDAQVPALDAQRRAALYSLATLTGRTPESFDRETEKCVTPPKVARAYPVGDGAALLARRPDVRQAERTLAADTARIGISTADLYPSISLLGEASIGSQHFGDLGKSRSFSYFLGPSISWTFPLQNAARARVHEAKATTEGTLARFDGVVLNALKETEQALAQLSGELQRNESLARAFAASDHAAVLSRERFKAGADSFLQLLDAERTRASASSSLAVSNQTVAEAQVNVFKALGGGWSQAPETSRLARDPTP